jgi:hypothetical protein
MNKYPTRAKSKRIQAAIAKIFLEMEPKLTVRQIYYALTVRDIVPKTEAGYRQTDYQLNKMRENGIIPYGWIADNTRYCLKPVTDRSLEAALYRCELYYRRDFWANQDDQVEIWVEKDALAGVIRPITDEYDVPLFVARGYSSQTFIYEAAEQIKQIGKTPYIYHFGDFDPSGVDAAYQIEMGLWKHGVDVHFERVAITEEQIEIYQLPVRETKASDPRAKTWGNKPSVELDALPAPILRDMVRECIEYHIDTTEWERLRLIEEHERETLAKIRLNLVQVQKSQFGGVP